MQEAPALEKGDHGLKDDHVQRHFVNVTDLARGKTNYTRGDREKTRDVLYSGARAMRNISIWQRAVLAEHACVCKKFAAAALIGIAKVLDHTCAEAMTATGLEHR